MQNFQSMFHAIPAVHLCILYKLTYCTVPLSRPLRRALSTASVIQEIRHPDVRSEYRPVASPPCQTIEHAASSAETLSTAGMPAAPMMRAFPFSHADRDGHGKARSRVLRQPHSAAALGRRKAQYERQQHHMSAHSVLCTTCAGNSASRPESTAAPSPSPARRPVRPPAAATAQEHHTQEQEHRCPHYKSSKLRICCLFIRLPLGKVIEQHIPGSIF